MRLIEEDNDGRARARDLRNHFRLRALGGWNGRRSGIRRRRRAAETIDDQSLDFMCVDVEDEVFSVKAANCLRVPFDAYIELNNARLDRLRERGWGGRLIGARLSGTVR